MAQDRIVGVGGSRLDGRQYLFARNMSMGTHPSEFHYFAPGSKARVRYACVKSVGVESAFDMAPRLLLFLSFGRMSASPYSIRRLPRGFFRCKSRGISGGVPHEGIFFHFCGFSALAPF